MPTGAPDRLGDAVRQEIGFSWPLEPLALQPGDRVTWQLAVRDTFALDGRTHAAVYSRQRTIKVISQTELLKHILDTLAVTRRQLAGLNADQSALARGLKAPDAAKQSPETLNKQAADQTQIARQTHAAAGALAAAARRLQLNRIDRPDLTSTVIAAATQLKRLETQQMARAIGDLRQAGTSDLTKAAHVADAAKAAGAAAAGLDNLLRQTAGWTTVESAALGLQNLIARQQSLRDQTAETAGDALGKPLDALHGTQRQALQALADQQRSLADQLGRLQADMATQAETPESPSTQDSAFRTEHSELSTQTESLRQALAALQEPPAVAAMATAASDLAGNLTASAQDRQQQAQRALTAALAALQGGPSSQSVDSSTNRADSTALSQHLRQLAQHQTQLKDQTADLNAKRDETGRLNRPSLIRLAMAGRDQTGLASQVVRARQMTPDTKAQQALASVASQMEDIADQMRAGVTDQPVQNAQQQAAGRLLAMADVLDRQAGSAQPQEDVRSQNSANHSSANGAANRQAKAGGISGKGQSQQEGQGRKGGASANRGRRGNQGAADSFVPPDQQPGPVAALSQLNQVEAWGFLPPDQRRQVLQGMQAEPPQRYRRITERYWRLLNEVAEDNGQGIYDASQEGTQ